MWNLYLIFGNLCIVSLSYLLAERIDKYTSLNVDVLSNTSPPVVNTELQHGIKFFNDETLNLECGIDGKPRPLYQWYVSTSEAEDMYSNIADMQFKNVSFGNKYILEIDGRNPHKKFFKYIYYCSAQNPLGILHSNKVIVEKVSRPTPIEIKYTLFNVYESEKFVVHCQTVPDLWARLFKFVRWEVREKPGYTIHLNKTKGRYSVITSTKTPQLHIRNITKDDFDRTKIRCIFKSIVHKGYDISPGLFKSIEKLSYNVPSYLSNLCGDGETISVNVGANLELPWCSIPTTLDVTWYKVDNLNKIEIEITENNSKYKMISRRYGNLLIINTTKEDSGKYMARTTGKAKLIKIVFTVTVYEPPIITLTPSNIISELSEPAEFHCSASYSKSRFYWLHNGQKVTSGYDDGNVEIFEKIHESILRVKKIRISVTGVYQCIAAADNELKGFSEYKQLSASLLLSKLSPFLHRQSPRVERDTTTALIQMSKNNKIKTIECIFSANPKPSIDWYLNSAKVPIEALFSIIIKEDFNSIYNFITKLTIDLNKLNYNEDMRKYAGEYQAVATNSLGVASCSTFVLMDGSLELRLPQNQTAVGGKDYLLTCYFVAMGVPEFSWDRQTNTGSWESMPSNHRTIMKDNNHKLLLKDVIKTEDEGIYRCTAKFNKEIQIANTSLNVANPPNLQNLPSKQDISEINYHICTVNNKADKPWYVWWTFTRYSSNKTTVIDPDNYNSASSEFSVKYDSITLNHNNNNVKGVPNFVYQYSNKGVNLNIKERSYDKSALGKFTCHARNHIGSAEMSIEDKFLSLEFKIVPPSTSEVVVGNDLYLNCTAKESDLNPFTKWKISYGEKYIEVNDTKELYGNRIYQYANGTLVMKNIRETDPSRMFCFIIPSKKNFEVHSKVAYIDIRIPARVQPMLKEIFVVAGKSFNLSCYVYGHTKNMEVTWFHRLSNIGQWENIYKTCIYSLESVCVNKYQPQSGKFNPKTLPINATFNVVHLEFFRPEESIAGQYKCEALNKFNKVSDEAGTHLIVISQPGKVIFHPEQKPSTPTSIEIKWRHPMKNGNRPIKGYILKYSELVQADKKNTSEKIFNISNNVLFKKIDNLRPFRTYEISVAAENEVGIGEPSMITVITQESTPERPIRSLKAISTLPDEITVTWDIPEQAYQNGRILHYLLCYQKIPASLDNVNIAQLHWPKPSDDYVYNIDIKCEKVQTTSFSANKLPQFTDFGIRVIAFNSKGPSPAAFTKVRTLEDLPQAPPTQLSCKTQQQQITLHWNPPPFQTINGVLTGYTVNYYKPNKYGDESLMTSLTVHGTDMVILDQLEPDTGYSIQIMAMNRKGNGPPSTRIICKTAEAKPEAPEMAKVVKVNNTCWKIVWLHTTRPHGRITAYCVIETGGYSDKLKCQSPEMNKRYNYMTRCDLSDITKIRVFAKNTYDGAMKEVIFPKDNDVGDIISLGGIINVNEGSSILLPCESDFHNTIWKKDNIKISNNENSQLKIFPNNSLEIKSIEKYTNHIYICSNDRDSIEYTINVLDPPDGLLRPPLISDVKVTENSIFVSWKSGGTTNIAAPITGFSLVWNNLYTGELKTVSLDGNSRTFYLNNVTCGSEFHLKILAKNGEGQSEFSNIKKLRTLGSAPLIPDANAILQSVESHNVLLNLNAFAPGDNCSAIYFKVEVSITSGGSNYNGDLIFNKNISIYELENKCCYRVTRLHPMTFYKFDIIAYNPAGSTSTRHVFKTIQNPGFSSTKSIVTENPINNSWLLMIVLVIAVVLIMGILVIAVLYILRHRDPTKSNHDNPGVRKSEFSQPNRIAPPEDTTSMDSNGEPSPYAVYQPDTDPKPNHLWSQQISQTNSPPGYNYPDHLYNKIRYDKIHQLARPMQESQGDFIRRVNSAECLSSVGNASVSGIADLESPSNIDPNDPMFHKTYKRNSNNDDVFQNIQSQGCSTVNRSNKRLRRESENLHYAEEERVKLVNQNPGWRNIQRNQTQSIYNKSTNPSMRYQYHTQFSVPEPLPTCSQQYGYHQSGRIRTKSGVGSSQVTIPSGASQINNYGNYYETTHSSQSGYPNAKRDNSNSIIPPAIEPYSKYVPKNHQPIYGSQLQRATVPRQDFITTNGNVPRTNRNECSDDEIYTDRVVLV